MYVNNVKAKVFISRAVKIRIYRINEGLEISESTKKIINDVK